MRTRRRIGTGRIEGLKYVVLRSDAVRCSYLRMAKIKFGDPFGLDNRLVDSIDWDVSISRILQDVRSDFIYAPHLSTIYAKAGTQLSEALKKELLDGTYVPGNPITLEVPKTYRMRVAVKSKRLGPNYSRPGSILLPKDRLLYQALADQAANVVNKKTDKTRSFSHRLGPKTSPTMFLSTRSSWDAMQKALKEYSHEDDVRYIIKMDITDYFGSINQHTLINTLEDDGYPSSLSSRLEALLIGYTGERSSRSILQGMFPSDLFGSYYLTPIDRFLEELGVRSARYVDDMYVFVGSVDEADKVVRDLIPRLRGYDLVLSEAKSAIIPKAALLTEEPDLEDLFSAAVDEISDQLTEENTHGGYGFQAEWEGDVEDKDEFLQLEATKVLFDSLGEYPGQEENIERFCLPIFSQASSDYAITHVFEAFDKRSSMTQLYTSYLSNFVEDDDVAEFLTDQLDDTSLMDWQVMWVLASLLRRRNATPDGVKRAWVLAKAGLRHDAMRAVAAIYVGRFGDLDRRKALIALYPQLSQYMQCAIYYSSQTWPANERTNARAMWGAQGELNKLLTLALAAKT